MHFISTTLIILLFSCTICNAQNRPSLFFREDFKEIPAATPVTQEHLVNKDVIIGLYGPGRDSIKKTHHDVPADDPYYIWSGVCKGNWVMTLKKDKSYVDLSGYAKIIWRSKQAGFRCLHLVIKLADGTWLVSGQCDDRSQDWRVRQFNIMDIDWYELNVESVIEGSPVKNVNLSKVDEIGFTDLMTGGGSDACSRVDWIEVYGNAVERGK
jgi:hypothetical protein